MNPQISHPLVLSLPNAYKVNECVSKSFNSFLLKSYSTLGYQWDEDSLEDQLIMYLLGIHFFTLQ